MRLRFKGETEDTLVIALLAIAAVVAFVAISPVLLVAGLTRLVNLPLEQHERMPFWVVMGLAGAATLVWFWWVTGMAGRLR